MNLYGIDPRLLFITQQKQGTNFNLVNFIKSQTELCAVFVRKTDFPYLKRYAALVEKNPLVEKEGVAGYEISLNYNGVPIKFIPRAPSEAKGFASLQLLRVNAEEQNKNPGRHLVLHSNSGWQLSNTGLSLIELLTY